MKWHPDKNKDNQAEASRVFQDIGEAYDVLGDKRNRAVYDQYGYEGLHDGVPARDGNKPESYTYKKNGLEIFESFFGTSNPFVDFGFGDTMPFAARLKKQNPRKLDPVKRDLFCSLEELYNGCTKTFKITRKRITPEGTLAEASTQLTVKVKPGWKKGTKITFPGEGDEAPDYLPADVVLVVAERPHKSFDRNGNDLIYKSTVSLADALTDYILEVPTLDGRVLRLACPEIVSPGYERRLGGEGMPISKKPGSRGDLVVRFKIVFPAFLPHPSKIVLRRLLAPEIGTEDAKKTDATNDGAVVGASEESQDKVDARPLEESRPGEAEGGTQHEAIARE
ncbi:unnamed protein product [Ascophyllum nodosum]